MRQRKLGRTGLHVSELCLGTMQFGWSADESASFQVMDAFAEAGGNFIDTADIYSFWGEGSYAGKTEEIIGRWFADRKNREQIILATKVRGEMGPTDNERGLSRRHIIRACEASLRRLQTDYIDLYQCHWTDLNTPIEETLSALETLVQQGKVLYIGASNYPAWRLMEAISVSEKRGWARFDSYQPEWSLMERALFEPEAMALCRHYGLGVIPYSPLAAGFLTGKYRKDQSVQSVRSEGVLRRYGNDRGWAVLAAMDSIAAAHDKPLAAVALAWLLANPVCTAPILGANNVDQLKDQLAVVGFSLTAEEKAKLDEATSYPKNWRDIWD